MDSLEAYLSEICVDSSADYVADESNPDDDKYVFSYTIRIVNQGDVPARLISRRWIITDGNGDVHEINGMGVAGKQPYLKPGDVFSYTSGAIIGTPVGSIHGCYQMLDHDGNSFETEVAPFSLAMPEIVH